MDDRVLIYGFAVPLAIGAALVLPAAWRSKEAERTRGAAWAVMLAMEIAVLAALLVWEGENIASWDWQLALLLPVVGFQLAALTLSAAARPAVHLVCAAIMGLLTTGVLWRFMAPDPWPIRVIPGAGTFVLLALLEPLARRQPGPAFVFGLGLGAAGCTLVALGGAMLGPASRPSPTATCTSATPSRSASTSASPRVRRQVQPALRRHQPDKEEQEYVDAIKEDVAGWASTGKTECSSPRTTSSSCTSGPRADQRKGKAYV
jgi:hypothetical protein